MFQNNRKQIKRKLPKKVAFGNLWFQMNFIRWIKVNMIDGIGQERANHRVGFKEFWTLLWEMVGGIGSRKRRERAVYGDAIR